jgi:crotonobetainyl-CoA:carnitine CoA-transferase CaiB-like acyl-CoA transferase
MAAFGGQVPAAPVRSVAEALEHADPQALAEVSVPGAEPLRLLRSPLRDSKPGQAVAAAPALGEHTAELLAEIGIDAPTLAALRARGVV